MIDPKDGPRIKASREGWKKLQETKSGPCRVTGESPFKGGVELHHLVPRSQQGDDVEDNLVPLSREVHRRVEASDYEVRSRLRANLSQAEIDYVIRKKGWAYLERRYPLPADAVDKQLSMETEPWWGEPEKNFPLEVMGRVLESVDPAPGSQSEASSALPTPGDDCPTCHRRVPHRKTAASPKSSVISYRVPDESRDTHKETLEAAARHLNIYDKPFWMERLMTVGAVLILQGPADLLS